MLRRFFIRLAVFFAPLQAIANSLLRIAQDLHVMRQLYEAELAERKPPILLRTEKPSDEDTEVTYYGVKPVKGKSALEKLGEEDEYGDDYV